MRIRTAIAAFFYLCAMSLLVPYNTAAAQCPNTGETKVIKPNVGAGYNFYYLIGAKSFQYYLDGKNFSMLETNDPSRHFFRVDKLGFEVMLAPKSDFKKFIKKLTLRSLLEAQAQYEQDYFKELSPNIVITDLGIKQQIDTNGAPGRFFLLWKKQNAVSDANGVQYLLSTPLDNNTVVVLSALILEGATESDVFAQLKTYTSRFNHVSSEQCQQLSSKP